MQRTERSTARPLCPYPQIARYKGTGNIADAENFACGEVMMKCVVRLSRTLSPGTPRISVAQGRNVNKPLITVLWSVPLGGARAGLRSHRLVKGRSQTLQHFQSVVRLDTTDPPGNERPAAEYLKQVLEKEGIATKVFEIEPNRLNVVARLKGNGSKRPFLMGHTDTVNVDPAKWTFPPFSATRDGGYIYGRGTVDDKDNVTASLATMLLLKRSECAARARCHISCGGWRRRHDACRHSVRGSALCGRSTPSTAWPKAAVCFAAMDA